MSLRVVTGAAGTGKTTRLLALVDVWLATHSLSEGQRVLALTFMHGSRIRLSDRLRGSAARGRFDCVTFDGFARELCARWRTRLASLGVSIPGDVDEGVYDATCEAAATLLEDPLIARWVAAAHPLIIVDEFQDCYGARPRLIERLAAVAEVLVAADPFQDLSDVGENPAMAMLASAGVPHEELGQVHRTKVSGLLAGALALRDGKPLVAGAGLAIENVPSEHVGAWKVCLFIAKLKGATAAVLGAGKPIPSNFARKVLDAAAATSGYGPTKSLGPYTVRWESSPDVHRENLLDALAIGEAPQTASAIRAALPAGNPLARFVDEWLERERRLRGLTTFSPSEIRAQVVRAESAHRAMPRQGSGVRALTIHQAKNREFDRVVVLWGYTVPKEAQMRRRWLYNAITRARVSATVIVQGHKKRLKEAPFA